MPKNRLPLKIVAYDKNNELFSQRTLYAYQYSEAFTEFNRYIDFFTSGEFPSISRIDLVSGSRILFSCVSLRHKIDQKNFTINFNPF